MATPMEVIENQNRLTIKFIADMDTVDKNFDTILENISSQIDNLEGEEANFVTTIVPAVIATGSVKLYLSTLETQR